MNNLETRKPASDAIEGDLEDSDPKKEQAEASADYTRAEVQGRKDYFNLRKKWSYIIIIWISLLILFNIGLTLSVGLELLSFENYQWFITAITVETFLQIVGLGFLAVRFLFSDS